MRARLIERYRRRVSLDDIAQVIAIAHAREPRLLLGRRHAGEIVGGPLLDALDVGTRSFRQWRAGKNVAPGCAFAHDHKFVGAESLAIEENAAGQSALGIEFFISTFLGQRNRIDSQGAQQSVRYGAVAARTVDCPGSAIHERQPAGELELVALGVAAYVVVIVENENARIRLPGAIKMCSREPADAAAYDDQIIVFAGRCDRPGARPETGLAQRMRGLEAARMAATQPSQRRRIIAGGILCRGFLRRRRSGERGRNHAARRSPDGERYAIQKISSRDAFVHGAISTVRPA